MRVNEIFYSLQGEGAYSGSAAIFIRLAGCNLHCVFCDTQHQSYKEYTKEEIYQEIKDYAARHIVFTGGEPSLQLNAETIDYFHKHGYFVQVETNGTKKLPYNVDWVTCSPKDLFCNNAEIRQEKIDEIKVVFDGEHMPDKYMNLKAKARFYCLQPCDTGDEVKNREIINQCVEFIKNNPQWKLSLQTQKILKVR